MLGAKLKELLLSLKAGRVTLPYPFKPHPPEEGFRGKIKVDPEKCIGCGGCANVCPSRLIEVHDFMQEVRVLVFNLERCTFCGRCAEVCPEGAIEQTLEFELAVTDPQKLRIVVEVFMGTCQRCGRCFEPPTPLERMMVTGFREPMGEGR